MLRLEKISYSTGYPRNIEVFSGVEVDFPVKRNVVIFGDNGSGKTTLVKLLMKFITPTSGIVVGGTEMAVGIFEDYDDQLFFSTVYEEFSSITKTTVKKYKSVLSLLKLESLLERSSLELSYSQKARLVFGLAYLVDREFMIIDSPPVDEKIDGMISKIALEGHRTILLLLPKGDAREFPGIWDEYVIENRKLKLVGRS